MSKLIIISAPSGTGKSTIIAELMKQAELRLRFSVSATSRPKRAGEEHQREYYFFSPEEFRQRIEADEFIEWEEVYQDKFYGTLKSEVEGILNDGANVIFDIDYAGALNIKKLYGEEALAIFIKPPSLGSLEERLIARATDSKEVIRERLAKAEEEIASADKFDVVFVNDKLEDCIAEVQTAIKAFI